jgi:hypothetical protein
MVRSSADGPLEAILVLGTLGVPERRLRDRRGRDLTEAEAAAVPTTRVTVVRPEPFASPGAAEVWLDGVRGDGDAAATELEWAVRTVNRALHAHRVAAVDALCGDVSAAGALVARVGYGDGERVADGRFERAWEAPRAKRKRARRSMEAPDERFAALLGGRERALPAEELTLRARADLDAGRIREAALEARVALEALLAELGEDRPSAGDRGTVGEAANAALRGELPADLETRLREAVERMEKDLTRHRLRGQTP